MRLLLDTHTLIWFLENHPKLSPPAKAAMLVTLMDQIEAKLPGEYKSPA